MMDHERHQTTEKTTPGLCMKDSKNWVRGDFTFVTTADLDKLGRVRITHHNITGEKLNSMAVPRKQLRDHPDSREEIWTIRKAFISALLNHPNICSLHEISADEHRPIYPLTNNGIRLLDYIISHGRTPSRLSRNLARQIGSAIEYLHSNNIVHRDIRIETVLLTLPDLTIKLTDFSQSTLFDPLRRVNPSPPSSRGYFPPPELLTATSYIGPELDIWCFGVLLYILICGKVPFDAPSLSAIHELIKVGKISYPILLNRNCKRLLKRTLNISPDYRASISEVLLHPWMTHSAPP